MKRLLIAMIVAPLAGCALRAVPDKKPEAGPTAIINSSAAEEWDIREATFRYQFRKNASGQQQAAKVYCLELAVDGKRADPDDAFLKRFAGNKPPVKKGSECGMSAEQGVVIDKETGASGLIFNTGDIQWVSDTEVEVSGGYYEASLSASGNVYSLKKVNGIWTVIKEKMTWIS